MHSGIWLLSFMIMLRLIPVVACIVTACSLVSQLYEFTVLVIHSPVNGTCFFKQHPHLCPSSPCPITPLPEGCCCHSPGSHPCSRASFVPPLHSYATWFLRLPGTYQRTIPWVPTGFQGLGGWSSGTARFWRMKPEMWRWWWWESMGDFVQGCLWLFCPCLCSVLNQRLPQCALPPPTSRP